MSSSTSVASSVAGSNTNGATSRASLSGTSVFNPTGKGDVNKEWRSATDGSVITSSAKVGIAVAQQRAPPSLPVDPLISSSSSSTVTPSAAAVASSYYLTQPQISVHNPLLNSNSAAVAAAAAASQTAGIDINSFQQLYNQAVANLQPALQFPVAYWPAMQLPSAAAAVQQYQALGNILRSSSTLNSAAAAAAAANYPANLLQQSTLAALGAAAAVGLPITSSAASIDYQLLNAAVNANNPNSNQLRTTSEWSDQALLAAAAASPNGTFSNLSDVNCTSLFGGAQSQNLDNSSYSITPEFGKVYAYNRKTTESTVADTINRSNIENSLPLSGSVVSTSSSGSSFGKTYGFVRRPDPFSENGSLSTFTNREPNKLDVLPKINLPTRSVTIPTETLNTSRPSSTQLLDVPKISPVSSRSQSPHIQNSNHPSTDTRLHPKMRGKAASQLSENRDRLPLSRTPVLIEAISPSNTSTTQLSDASGVCSIFAQQRELLITPYDNNRSSSTNSNNKFSNNEKYENITTTATPSPLPVNYEIPSREHLFSLDEEKRANINFAANQSSSLRKASSVARESSGVKLDYHQQHPANVSAVRGRPKHVSASSISNYSKCADDVVSLYQKYSQEGRLVDMMELCRRICDQGDGTVSNGGFHFQPMQQSGIHAKWNNSSYKLCPEFDEDPSLDPSDGAISTSYSSSSHDTTKQQRQNRALSSNCSSSIPSSISFSTTISSQNTSNKQLTSSSHLLNPSSHFSGSSSNSKAETSTTSSAELLLKSNFSFDPSEFSLSSSNGTMLASAPIQLRSPIRATIDQVMLSTEHLSQQSGSNTTHEMHSDDDDDDDGDDDGDDDDENASSDSTICPESPPLVLSYTKATLNEFCTRQYPSLLEDVEQALKQVLASEDEETASKRKLIVLEQRVKRKLTLKFASYESEAKRAKLFEKETDASAVAGPSCSYSSLNCMSELSAIDSLGEGCSSSSALNLNRVSTSDSTHLDAVELNTSGNSRCGSTEAAIKRSSSQQESHHSSITSTITHNPTVKTKPVISKVLQRKNSPSPGAAAASSSGSTQLQSHHPSTSKLLHQSQHYPQTTATNALHQNQTTSNASAMLSIGATSITTAAADSRRSVHLSNDDLVSGQRVLLRQPEGLYSPGKLIAMQPPDVYGVLVDGARGSKPQILAYEELMKRAVLEIIPRTKGAIPKGTKVCAHYSSSFTDLHPGTVSVSTKTLPHVVKIEFDDGDEAIVKLTNVRILSSLFNPSEYNLLNPTYAPNPTSKSPNSRLKQHQQGNPREMSVWRWDQKCLKETPLSKNIKAFYSSISKSNAIVQKDDFVSFHKSPSSSGSGIIKRPYIGQVINFFETVNGDCVVKVSWYYRSEETKQGLNPTLPKNALLRSNHTDELDIQTISHKVEVLDEKEYANLNHNIYIAAQAKGTFPDNLFVYAGTYDFIKGITHLTYKKQSPTSPQLSLPSPSTTIAAPTSSGACIVSTNPSQVLSTTPQTSSESTLFLQQEDDSESNAHFDGHFLLQSDNDVMKTQSDPSTNSNLLPFS